MTKNNSKEPTWKDIEEEFHKQFDSKTYDFYQGWTFDEIDEILAFFKPYFQEIECDCCGWDNAGLTHEPYCKLKQ